MDGAIHLRPKLDATLPITSDCISSLLSARTIKYVQHIIFNLQTMRVNTKLYA